MNILKKLLKLKTLPKFIVSYKLSRIRKKSLDTTKKRAKFIRKLFNKKKFDLREEAIILFFANDEKTPLGYVNIEGGKTSVFTDDRLILQTAIGSGASSFIIAHNHPLEGHTPSDADLEATHALDMKASYLGLDLVDSLVFSRKGYFSFSDHGLIRGYD